MASNHQALYIHILAVSVLYQLSIKVPSPMAAGKRRNSTAINRLENKYFRKTSFIILKYHAKILDASELTTHLRQ